MLREGGRFSQFVLISAFASFYLTIEFLYWSQALFFSTEGLVAVVLISFLNLIPAGIFAFSLVSILPRRFSTNLEDDLLKLAPHHLDPRVAVVYTTYNDFMREHAEYDLKEAREAGMAFFILDDSTDPSKMAEVDSFSLRHECQVLRRKKRRGYKAGAINEWVSLAGNRFDYFFILDSDSRADHRTIQYCLELARRDLKIAVVQSKTLTMTSNPTRLTRSAVTIQHAYMEIVQKAMRNLGTSPYYGHNALVKVEALMSVGGFVEESNEDYKTLALLHAKRYSSVYAERAISWEEVPPDYISARKRALRWSRDAVSQLRLLKFGTPIAIAFFLFYGWVTHMANVALVGFLPFMAWAALPHLFSNTMIEVSGSVTLAVIVLWPLAALRVKDSELTSRKMASALLWGSAYNIPMMAPIALHILKTMALKVWTKCTSQSGFNQQFIKEFVVTPKTKQRNESFGFFVSKMKAEIFVGITLIAVAVGSRHLWALLFASPQILSALCLPVLVYAESRDRARVKGLERTVVLASPRMTSPRFNANLLIPNTLRLGLR